MSAREFLAAVQQRAVEQRHDRHLQSRSEFDRWLAAHDATVRADHEKALRERIAQDIDAQGDAWHRDAKIERSCYRHAARIVREGA